ncbi:MAG: RimK family protein [Nannocystaceae bacterium]|nr:RimK family protein [Nannocystaceae bacterium]
MPILIVVSDLGDWPIEIAGAKVVLAREYLTKPEYVEITDAKVFNLCRSYRYQKLGYYVSLVAAARGQRPFPTPVTIQDLKSRTMASVVDGEIDELIQHSLRPLSSERFVLTAYFGRNIAARHGKLAQALFRRFPAPLLRAEFAFHAREKRWALDGVEALAPTDVPEEHREFLVDVAKEYFRRRHHVKIARAATTAYDLAILTDPEEPQPPSCERAIQKFVGAAESLGFDVEIIGKHDYPRLAEFDALFIRATTSVNHRTFRFSRKAAAEGLIVIDDPESILRCTNKVFLAELLHQHDVPTPRTMVVHRGNAAEALGRLGLPCILKQPDSSFSQGVSKAETPEEFRAQLERLLGRSDLVIAQEFAPTTFDWRIGVLDRQPIYACKYFMAGAHWQVIHRDGGSGSEEGPSEAVPLDKVPRKLLRTAVKAANLIGDGLYGVDLKEYGEAQYSVIEVNDNPSIDAGVEDELLMDELYRAIMRVFRNRLEARRRSL